MVRNNDQIVVLQSVTFSPIEAALRDGVISRAEYVRHIQYFSAEIKTLGASVPAVDQPSSIRSAFISRKGQ